MTDKIQTITIPLIPKSKKNRLMPRKDGKGYFYAGIDKEVKELPLFFKKLKSLDPNESVGLQVLIDTKEEKCVVSVWSGLGYKLKRHTDLDGVVTAICDGLTKAGIIKDDSRITFIKAEMV